MSGINSDSALISFEESVARDSTGEMGIASSETKIYPILRVENPMINPYPLPVICKFMIIVNWEPTPPNL